MSDDFPTFSFTKTKIMAMVSCSDNDDDDDDGDDGDDGDDEEEDIIMFPSCSNRRNYLRSSAAGSLD